jgi:hypothetical protein
VLWEHKLIAKGADSFDLAPFLDDIRGALPVVQGRCGAEGRFLGKSLLDKFQLI